MQSATADQRRVASHVPGRCLQFELPRIDPRAAAAAARAIARQAQRRGGAQHRALQEQAAAIAGTDGAVGLDVETRAGDLRGAVDQRRAATTRRAIVGDANTGRGPDRRCAEVAAGEVQPAAATAGDVVDHQQQAAARGPQPAARRAVDATAIAGDRLVGVDHHAIAERHQRAVRPARGPPDHAQATADRCAVVGEFHRVEAQRHASVHLDRAGRAVAEFELAQFDPVLGARLRDVAQAQQRHRRRAADAREHARLRYRGCATRMAALDAHRHAIEGRPAGDRACAHHPHPMDDPGPEPRQAGKRAGQRRRGAAQRGPDGHGLALRAQRRARDRGEQQRSQRRRPRADAQLRSPPRPASVPARDAPASLHRRPIRFSGLRCRTALNHALSEHRRRPSRPKPESGTQGIRPVSHGGPLRALPAGPGCTSTVAHGAFRGVFCNAACLADRAGCSRRRPSLRPALHKRARG